MRRIALVVLAACAHPGEPPGSGSDAPVGTWQLPLGAHWEPDGGGVVFRVASTRATRIELSIYDVPMGGEPVRIEMTRDVAPNVWRARVPAAELPETIYYGYRVWGPNWPWDPAWAPGSVAGWIADVDADGNRMNPNKLVFDPYALELSHDPTGVGKREVDSGPFATKGIVLREMPADVGVKPLRPLADDIIYEVHLRGFSKLDAGACAGTYAGAAARAQYLADLGVTAVEFLPLHETGNDRNDVDPTSAAGDNYWGYSTLSFFAPDRRYACDRSPGGPTREVREMVRAFHERGIKVFVDVVYNHTAEGGGGSQLSLRGLDNAGYYQLDRNGTGFTNSNGVGADVATDKPLAAALVIDSLKYWSNELGVDGFRFDLAPVLANKCGPGCYQYDPHGLPETIAKELARPASGGAGVDLIAEPWGVVAGSYQVGRMPPGWSEWNDKFRDLIRQDQNEVGVTPVTPGWLADRLSASSELYRHDGREPSASINYLVSHDGFTLHDLYACNGANNHQMWPYGPSDGGTTSNHSWDHRGDPVLQRQATRTGLALVLLSIGVPMIVGGDELAHSQRCNNNPYNLDSPATWLDYATQSDPLWTFTQRMMQFRSAHPELRADWSGVAQIAWFDAAGHAASAAYMDDASRPTLTWRAGDTIVAYNRAATAQRVILPAAGGGRAWYRVADTGAWMEPQANCVAPGDEYRMNQANYDLAARSLALFIAK